MLRPWKFIVPVIDESLGCPIMVSVCGQVNVEDKLIKAQSAEELMARVEEPCDVYANQSDLNNTVFACYVDEQNDVKELEEAKRWCKV